MIAFHRVKKSSLIIRIVDRIKINSEQLLPFSESELSIPYFLQIVRITYVCFVYFAAIAQVWINLHRQHVMSFIQWWRERRAKSLVAKEISGRVRRRSRNEKANQGVGDFRFINIVQVFSIYCCFFNLSFFFYTFFTHDIYPHPHPRPTTHDPRPLPTTHDPRHLATLITVAVCGLVISPLIGKKNISGVHGFVRFTVK